VKLDRDVERGTILEVERDALPPTEDDEYYAFQLVGLPVAEENGRALGSVKVVVPGVAHDVLELDTGVLLPMVEECILKIDLEASAITVAAGFAD
jgi:16S rRNA processing protein RimM